VTKLKRRIGVWALILVGGLSLESWALHTLRPSAGRWRSEAVVKDEPVAHALYDQMTATMRDAGSLSYECTYSSPGRKAQRYLVWLKKPNYFRVEAINARGARTGTLVGDGSHLWIYWPGECPQIDPDDKDVPPEARLNLYMMKATPVGRHSIGHEVMNLGPHMPIIDPSTFHGYTDSLQPYIDGAAGRGTDRIAGQECDVIEVSIMNAQRTWFFWISREDHLPRRMKQILRWIGTSVGVEEWSNVALGSDIPKDKFVWSPPEGWRQWIPPDPETKLLKPGQVAPDFALRSMDKGRIKLSDYRNEIVWLYIWRSG